MPARELPVRPDLDQLKHQAKDLLRALHDGEPSAVADLARYHAEPIEPSRAKLADAQLVLARSYGAPSWPRIVLSCQLIDAIWRDDVDAVRSLVLKTPKLLHENALIEGRNWGPPMSYAANLGRDAIIRMLHELGATDHLSAIGRATLQGQVGTGPETVLSARVLCVLHQQDVRLAEFALADLQSERCDVGFAAPWLDKPRENDEQKLQDCLVAIGRHG